MSLARHLFFPESRTTVDVANPRDPVLAEWFGGRSNTAAGVTVTPDRAMQLTAVYACVSLIAECVAQLPLHIYRRLPGNAKEPAPTHPLYRILHDQPNDWQTSFEFREMLQGHLCLRGNAYAEIIGNASNPVLSLIPLHPDRTTPFRAPNGSIAYRHRPDGGPERVLLQGEVMHLRGLSSDGLVGLSPIQLAKESIALGLAAEEFGGRFFGNGTVIGGVLEHPGKLSDEAYEQLKKSWHERHEGVAKSHYPAILEEGMKWQALGVKPEEAQFLETRKFQVTDIARLWRVPPHLIGDLEKSTSWGTGIEQQNIGLVTFTLMPWLVRWEQVIHRDLLTTEGRRRFFAKHRLEGFLRGDSDARQKFYTGMFNIGAFSPNDILDLEDRNPVEGGDQRFVPLNMIPLDQAGQAEGDETDNARSRQILAAAVQRVVRKETNEIAKAIRTRLDDFRVWAAEFYGRHASFVSQVLAIDAALAGAYAEHSADQLADLIESGDTDGLNDWSDNQTTKLMRLCNGH